MAETDVAELKSGKSQKLVLPAIIVTCVLAVLGLFTLGYNTLTTPEPIPSDIREILEKSKGKNEVEEKIVEDESPDAQSEKPEGQFDFSKYRYYTFPLPFVSNFENNKGMLTIEIAIATYGNTLEGESIMEKLQTSNPKLRSVINLKLSEQKYTDVNTVNKRQNLSKKLLEEVKRVVEELDGNPETVTDLHLIKFVVSGAN